MSKMSRGLSFAAVLSAAVLISPPACAKKPAWAGKNDKLIADKKIAVRTRDDIPAGGSVPNLADGVVTPMASLPDVPLAPGVKARMYWGKGDLVARLTNVILRAVPRDDPDGIHGRTPRNDFLLLEKGAESALQAGAGGAEIVEVYWPVRADYLAKAGVKNAAAADETKFPIAPTVLP
ncbi:MAG: hypothetical protein ABSA30_07600, partial [Candidatus Aminicenantales bacterium]